MSDKQPIVSEVCNELRAKRRKGIAYEDLDDEYTMSLDEIVSHIVGTSNVNENYIEEEPLDARKDEPWKEEYVVRVLYRKQRRRFTDMADILDCHSETAKKYVDKFDVSPIDSSDRTSSPRVNRLLSIGAEKDGDIDIKDE